MMRLVRIGRGATLAIVAAVAAPLSAFALEQYDVMSRWLESSEQERSHVLDELQAKDGRLRGADRSAVMACMNAAAGVPAHREFHIGDVAQACAEASAAPGAPQTEI